MVGIEGRIKREGRGPRGRIIEGLEGLWSQGADVMDVPLDVSVMFYIPNSERLIRRKT